MINKKTYIQYGAGNEAVHGWLSFDSSPTLRLQRLPIIGKLIIGRLNCVFDDDIKYGDIIKGLPLYDESVDVVFCSHILEHLSLEDFYIALKNTKKILKSGGVFRVIVPDLLLDVEDYLKAYSSPDGGGASISFFKNSCVGKLSRRKTIKEFIVEYMGNSSHLWMWDEKSLSRALHETGFTNIERFYEGKTDSNYELITRPERPHQFERGIALQCIKP
jgi:predicted SAM-dependent methyltransferase